MTINQFKTEALANLNALSPSANLDIQVFLEHSLGFNKTEILLKRDFEIPEINLQWLKDAVEKRKTGLPVAYITGHKEFFGYDFIVSPAVLIPKPDTEILVERSLELIKNRISRNPEKLFNICDMCTGSGCIGLSVLKNLMDSGIELDKLPKVTFVDISQSALEIARLNFENLLCLDSLSDEKKSLIKNRVRFIQSNLFEMVPWKFDYILTNPPYIPHKMVEELLKDGRSEPRLALNGDVSINGEKARKPDGSLRNDGLEIIRNMMPQIREHIGTYGRILMETGEYNAEETAALAEKWGFKTCIHKDLEEQLRVVEMY